MGYLDAALVSATAMSTAEIAPSETPQPHKPRGMALRSVRPITASTASTVAASQLLFGDYLEPPQDGDHRGIWLRYILRQLYGADYRKRGARWLGVTPGYLSRMMCTGSRVSRRIVERIESKLEQRIRDRRKELRALAEMVQRVFAEEEAGLRAEEELIAILLREASRAANTRQPHSSETGRFVSRVQGKLPDLREPGKKRAREHK